MAAIVFQAAALFSLVNVILLAGLMMIYGNSLRKIHAQFTIGLLFFTGFFMLQNLIALYSYVAMFMFYASDVAGLVLAITVAQTAGLTVLLWMALR